MSYLLSRLSLFKALVLLVVPVVALVMGGHAWYSYHQTKERLISEVKQRATQTITALRGNVSASITAYAVGEYERLILNEMRARDLYAIVVEDFNTGRVLGSDRYVSGKLRDPQWAIIDFDPLSPQHHQWLDQSYYSAHYPIVNDQGEALGTIGIYLSDRRITEQLHRMVRDGIQNTVLVALVFILLLFILLHRIFVAPIKQMVLDLGSTDTAGIPLSTIGQIGTKELVWLAQTLNRMTHEVRTSHQGLTAQHAYLQSIIDGVDDPIMVIDRQYNVVLMNRAAGRERVSSGLRAPKCHQLNHQSELPCSGSDHPCPLGEVIRTRQKFVTVHRHLGENGDWRYVELSATPLLDDRQEVQAVIECARDITQHLRNQEMLEHQKSELAFLAHHDALTGLANRVLFNERLEQGLSRARRLEQGVAVLFIDLDHFKEINDTLGHKTGDQVLMAVARRLAGLIRKEDTLARLGGDEFTIMVEGLADARGAERLARSILQSLSEPIELAQESFFVGCSIGISLYPDNGDNSVDLLKFADAAMYKAKSEGRQNFQLYNVAMTEQAVARLTLETQLRQALQQNSNELYVMYQPQVDALSGRFVGMEVLARWDSPTLGRVSPDRFIAVAESSGLINALGREIMRQSMLQYVQWHRQGIAPAMLAINFSLRQLQSRHFLEELDHLIRQTGFTYEWLELEVTESQLMTSPEVVVILEQLADKGVRVSLDDFGTGYSSLAYLKRLPIHKLKIDKSFVRDLPHDAEDVSITQAIIALARSLRLDVIAEGTESEAQRAFLIEQGCYLVQGYLYSKPLMAEEMAVLLRQGCCAHSSISSPLLEYRSPA